MKFSTSLDFNAHSDWKDNYINYDRLKKLIYKREVEETRGHSLAITSSDHRPSLDLSPSSGRPSLDRAISMAIDEEEAVTKGDLLQEFDKELNRITEFYRKKEEEVFAAVEAVEEEVRSRAASDASAAVAPALSRVPSAAAPAGRRSADEARSPLLPTTRAASMDDAAQQRAYWSQNTIPVRIARTKLKERMQDLYSDVRALAEFGEVNRTGFRKALKKHDKVLGHLGHAKLSATYMPNLEAAFPEKSQLRVQDALARLVACYATVFCQGSTELAELELRAEQRSQLKLERTTVWKDMVEHERRELSATVSDHDGGGSKSVLRRARRPLAIALSFAAFAVLLSVPLYAEPEKQNCAALLAFVSLLWCTEALPLYVTSMLVPGLAVALRVMTDQTSDPPTRKTAPDAADAMFKAMFSQTIMLLLGGFAIAAAFTKHAVARRLAVWVLARVGSRPAAVLIANMLVATFASMWITNVAAPVLCFSLLQPILRTVPAAGRPFCKALVLGIALASNLGGMTSPISSPQNIFAIQEMSRDQQAPSWLAWFVVALPVALVGNLACWGLLLAAYRPGRVLKEVRRLPDTSGPMGWKEVYVVAVALVTVALWCANSALAPYFGQMGIIAILPMVAFFGFGILSKDDFNNQLWNVVMLAMGGSALGEAVSSSGLLADIAQRIQDGVQGYGTWQVLAMFCCLVLIATTFISHTVGAMVILPIVRAVGTDMADPHPRLLVMGAALMCSGAMGLPVSGFPNMNAIALEDQTGCNYLTTGDFLRVGVPASVVAYSLVVSLGYGLMRFINGW